MNTENQPQMQARHYEDKLQELDEILHSLNGQISKVETMIHRALEQMNTIDVSTA
jgi:exonuclease VII small subunit